MIAHNCGTTLPTTVGGYVEHLAACTETMPQLRAWCRAIVSAVEQHTALDETPRETRDVSPSEMAAMRDAGKTLRDIAAVSGVAPETVRRRLARLAEGSES